MSSLSVGCTFIDWSVLYLSGQQQFYSFRTNDYQPLVSNPVTSMNAHGHKKNHESGFERNYKKINEFLANNSGLLTLYPAPIHPAEVAEHYNIDVNSPEFANNLDTKIKEFMYQDLGKLWHYLHSRDSKIIWVTDHPTLMAAHLRPRSTDNNLKNTGPTTLEELDREFQEMFYATSKATWTDLGLTSVWDERERRALDLRPYNNHEFNHRHHLPLDLPHLHITTAELWTQGETVIQQIMQFCELDIVPQRWQSWVKIHQQWQDNLKNETSFCFQLDTIINSIVNNWYYELGDLTFMQEVLIQHLLIYQHNLNLKTWELSKFPPNTQDLHKLLEPNIHPVPNIYNS